jgi:cystathionine beta-lyase/cystathionine gamma-synthase
VYGGTYRIFKPGYEVYGIEASYVEMSDLDAVGEALRPNTRMVWIETPTNPMLKIADIGAIDELLSPQEAHRNTSFEASVVSATPGVSPMVVVDNTFASPYLQQPLKLGADIVLHSATKYLGGHSDVVNGLIALNDDDVFARLKFLQNAIGAVPGPFDCFLVLRGIKTLHVRMERHSANAMKIATWLQSHPRVERVIYPGLKSHPQHEVARLQMCAFGGMISFVAKGGAAEARRIAEATKLFALAESLGGVESLRGQPSAHPPQRRHRER